MERFAKKDGGRNGKWPSIHAAFEEIVKGKV